MIKLVLVFKMLKPFGETALQNPYPCHLDLIVHEEVVDIQSRTPKNKSANRY